MIFPRSFVKVGGCFRTESSIHGKSQGYSFVQFGGRLWLAHRLSYSLNCGPIPRKPFSLKEGLVLHSCDNKWCINPDHLSLGTAKRNAKEKVERFPKWREKIKASASTPEARKRRSEAHKGIRPSKESLKKRSETMKRICAEKRAK